MKKFFFSLTLLFGILSNIQHGDALEKEVDYLWYKKATNVENMHNALYKGKGINILVYDTGIDTEHYEFQDLIAEDRLVFWDGSTLEERHYKEFYFNWEEKRYEDDSHGTSMTSLIAGKGIGVAPDSTIYYYGRSEGLDFEEQILELNKLIQKAIDKGDIDIISISQNFSISEENGTDVKEANDLLNKTLVKAEDAGILVVAAVGNNGEEDEGENGVLLPASHPSVLAVGSVELSGTQYIKASTSAIGPELDLVAPGNYVTVAVNSDYPAYIDMQINFAKETNNDKVKNYEKYQEEIVELEPIDSVYRNAASGGTSASAAITSGIAALYKQIYPNLSLAELKEMILENSNTDNILYEGNFESQFGQGLIQAPNLPSLTQIVNNRKVYGYGSYLFDGIKEGFLYDKFDPNDIILQRFEVPVTVNAFELFLYEENQDATMTVKLLDRNKSELHSLQMTNSGFISIPRTENVLYVQVENQSGSSHKVMEVDLLGTYEETYGKSIEYQSSTKLLDQPFDILKARNWNEENQHFNEFQVKLGSDNLFVPIWNSLITREDIFKEDLTSTVHSKIVKSENITYVSDLYNDFVGGSDYALLKPKGYVDYEFDVPVSISNAYINYDPLELNNQLEVVFYDKDNNESRYNISDDDLFDRYFELDKTYKDIKKIRVRNIDENKEMKVSEIGFYGIVPSVNASKPVSYKKTITLKAGFYKVTEDPYSNDYEKVEISSDFDTSTVKGYQLKYDNGNFEKIQVIMPDGSLKWVYTEDKEIDDKVFYNGLIDTLQGKIVEEGSTWSSEKMHDNAFASYSIPEIYDNSFVRYEWSQPTSVKSVYLNLYDYIQDQDHKMNIHFLDENQNILYSHKVSEEDLYKEFFELPEEIQNVKGFKIENKGEEHVRISELELF